MYYILIYLYTKRREIEASEPPLVVKVKVSGKIFLIL